MTRANLFIAGLLALTLAWLSAPCLGANWITAPQLCRGKAYSESARAAKWTFDAKNNASIAASDGATMYASVLPKTAANFVVNVSLKLPANATCRLNIGGADFDLSNVGAKVELVAEGKRLTALDETADPRKWILFTIRRRAGKITAEINGEHSFELGDDERVIKQIGLRSLQGAIPVRNFVVTGDVEAATK